MRIALLDLNHKSRGVHTNTVPLGCGLIKTYIEKQSKTKHDIRMFKEADAALSTFSSWAPDVVGLAQYSWNSEINLCVAKILKHAKKEVVVIAGGPNFDHEASLKHAFLKKHPFLDLCVSYDGEVPLAEIIKRLANNEPIEKIKETAPAGAYALHPKTGQLTESNDPPPRLQSLDVYGSVFADGVFDDFLKAGYHPFVQTHRGCPYTCTFCHTSDLYYSRMIFQSPDVFRKDMEYLGKMFAGRHEITLYIANTNMSTFQEDFEIARIIRETQDKYDWPKMINVNSGKDPKKLLDMLSIIKFQPSLALQTLTQDVLKNIKRRNLPFEEYCSFQDEVLRRTGETSTSELILCLPGETKASFLDTIRRVLNSGVQQIVVYTLMNLKGTPLASVESARTNEHLLKHRIVPRQFSIINGEEVFDTEEVIVGTKCMSYEDYLYLRGLCFTINTFFGSTELIPLKRFLHEYNLDMSDWVMGIHSSLEQHANIKKTFDEFMAETNEELFDSQEELIAYYSEDTHYQELIEGKKGDNLLRKYKSKMLAENYPSFLSLAISQAEAISGNIPNAKEMLSDLESYLSTRNMKPVLAGTLQEWTFSFSYEVPAWLESTDKKTLDQFSEKTAYTVRFDPQTHDRFKHFLEANMDADLSLQILFRDGTIRQLWPKWNKIQKGQQHIRNPGKTPLKISPSLSPEQDNSQ